MWHAYLLRCIDGSTYTGITTDIKKRFAQHQSGHGGRYTRSHPVKEIIAAVPIGTRAQASAFEYRAKRWPLKRKLGFFNAFAGDWRSYCGMPEFNHDRSTLMVTLHDALAIHGAALEQLSTVEMAVWQSIRQCAPTLADTVLQAGLDDIGAARWACFRIEELAGSPAQLIARGDIDQVLAYVLRVTHHLER